MLNRKKNFSLVNFLFLLDDLRIDIGDVIDKFDLNRKEIREAVKNVLADFAR